MITKKLLLEIVNMFPDIKLKLTFTDWQSDFYRFYHSQTNYNITKKTAMISITMVKDKRKLSFSLQNPTKESIIEAIKENIPILEMIPQDTDFEDFDNDKREMENVTKPNNIQKVPLETKIEILEKIAKKTAEYDFDIYGSFVCNYHKFVFVNSNGVAREFESSPIMLDVKAVSNKNEVTIIEKFGSENFEKFNLDRLITRLISKIKSAQEDIVDIEPGIYKVILSPYAIGEFVQYFLYNAYGSTLYSHQSFLEDKKDKKIFPELISIFDDPNNEDIINFHYNSDGRLLNKLPIIEKGIFKNFMINKYYSSVLKMDITGNEGANIVMDSGNNTLDEMISSIDNGLYISNIHYMNFINFKETSVTGLTRDGTFLIKNGKFSKVVNNLRFTLKISELLENVTMVENISHPVPSSSNYGYFMIYSYLMPHVKTEKFHISSSTKTI